MLILIGMTLGACLSLIMAAVAIFLLPMVMVDAGQLSDIVGTLVEAITAPLFGLAEVPQSIFKRRKNEPNGCRISEF